MAVQLVQLLNQVKELTFSPFKRPENRGDVLNNVFKFSIWGALGTGCAAGVSALFSRNMVERNTLAPSILKASLTSCATFTFFAAYIIYRCLQIPDKSTPDETRLFNQKVNTDIAFLEIGAITIVAAILAHDFLNQNQIIESLAERSIHPLLWIGMTMVATRIFHAYQQKQIGNP